MFPLTFILCFLAYGFSFGQQTVPLGILLQEEVPLRIQLREFPEAKKKFNQYHIKVISGAVVGASGVLLLNHSLGSISPRKPHQWSITGLGAGLIATGLFITKGAREKRQKAESILKQKKTIAIRYHSGGLSIRF